MFVKIDAENGAEFVEENETTPRLSRRREFHLKSPKNGKQELKIKHLTNRTKELEENRVVEVAIARRLARSHVVDEEIVAFGIASGKLHAVLGRIRKSYFVHLQVFTVHEVGPAMQKCEKWNQPLHHHIQLKPDQ